MVAFNGLQMHISARMASPGHGRPAPSGLGVIVALSLLPLVSAFAPPAMPAAAPLPTDYEVKAAFLYNFAKFVRWPDDAATGPTFVLVIVGDDPFGEVIDRAFHGKTVLGRPVEIRRTRAVREAAAAQMAFIGASERAQLTS